MFSVAFTPVLRPSLLCSMYKWVFIIGVNRAALEANCSPRCSAEIKNAYRGADKSLARPGRKQATATKDFEFHISYL